MDVQGGKCFGITLNLEDGRSMSCPQDGMHCKTTQLSDPSSLQPETDYTILEMRQNYVDFRSIMELSWAH
jgi:hypothetical protein